MKRALSLFIAVVMLIGTLAGITAVFAEEEWTTVSAVSGTALNTDFFEFYTPSGEWTVSSARAKINGVFGATASFSFKGSGLRVYATVNNQDSNKDGVVDAWHNNNNVVISIDGGAEVQMNMSSTTHLVKNDVLVYEITGLADETHNVVIKNKTSVAPVNNSAFSLHSISYLGKVEQIEIPDINEDEFEPVLRFIVASDMQKTASSSDANKKASAMIEKAYELAAASDYKKIDAVLIAGDVTEGSTEAEFVAAHSAITENIDFENTQLLTIMGNHEYYRWRWETDVDHLSGTDRTNANKLIAIEARKTFLNYFGDYVDYEYGGDGYSFMGYHTVINGFHFIGISSDWENRWAYDYNSTALNWLDEQMKAAIADDDTKPVFIQGHVGGENTVAGTGSDLANNQGSAGLNAILNQYPQAVMFSGHSHFPIVAEGSIHQKFYTNIGTGSLNNATPQRYNSASIANTIDRDADTFYIVEVDAEGNTLITPYDLSRDSAVWKKLQLVAPFDSTDYFKYTEAKQFSSEKDIKFPADAELQVYAQKNVAQISFDPADPYLDDNSLLAMVYYVVVEQGGNEVFTTFVGNNYHADGMLDKKLTATIGNLTAGTDYTVKVYGVNPKYGWNVSLEDSVFSKQPLTATFTTADGSSAFAPDIMNVEIDAVASTVTDSSENEMTATVNGAPLYKYDDTIDMDIIDLGGGATVKLADYVGAAFAMSYGFTVEAYFAVDTLPVSGYNAVISSMQGGGFGFEVKPDGICTFSVHDGTGYKGVSKTIEAGKYYHWVCSYDGSKLTCYVNGKKVGSAMAASPLHFQADSAKVVYLGADTSPTATPENPSDCKVAIARIYSTGANEDQAKTLWNAVREGRDPEIYDDTTVDLELLDWSYYDDCDSDHVYYVGKNGTEHRDHTDCENAPTTPLNISLDGDTLQYFEGGHLINGTAHHIIGNIKAVLEFYGCAFKIRTQYRGPMNGGYGDTLDVYIDGNYYDSFTGFSGNNNTSLYEVTISGLTQDDHVVEIYAADGRISIDSFAVGARELETYNMTVNVGEGGSSNLATMQTEEGSDLEFVLTPEEGYVVDSVTVNGTPVTVTGGRFTVENVRSNLTVDISFKEKTYVLGDIDGNEGVDANDAIYLLYNVFFGEENYPVDQECNFDGEGEVDANDAIYLLYYVFFGEESYPLYDVNAFTGNY